ncbi:SGNH/GDSL hydrolase family protein [PVC group bacterium]|nr:SGNH/GDSL hydrolase family protein [PVC group bacterium]
MSQLSFGDFFAGIRCVKEMGFDDIFKKITKEFSFVVRTGYHVKKLISIRKELKKRIDNSTNKSNSWNNNPGDIQIFKYCLQKLKEEAQNKKILLVIIPNLNEIYQYQEKSIEKTPLITEIEQISQELGIGCIDLFSEFIKSSEKFNEDVALYYLPYDRAHFSVRGHRIVSKIISENTLYKSMCADFL